MTVTADSSRRVILRPAKPGERFDLRVERPGRYILTKLEPLESRPAKVRLVKRNGYTVGVLDRPIDPEALKQALADFP
jgi:hypothetical protein